MCIERKVQPEVRYNFWLSLYLCDPLRLRRHRISPPHPPLKILSRIINSQIVWPPVHTDLLSFRICMEGSRIKCRVVCWVFVVVALSLLLISACIIKRACGLAFSNFRL